ncbi:MBL fold metallo-hydrolase [Comamonas serinivorans]|uniref:MBL fold metallo-hydrolase n=1 Tax=Comamonas serinivorans TaxID=1082851 RepID=UPI001F3D34A7|nr:3',5'-cyclic-nucleotide phosphodiesterase [Comamonas serinivorans]
MLGCSGGIVAGQHTTSFLVDDDILIDAGTGVASLTLDDMQRIDHVFLSHAHLDHILCLPLLLDAAGALRHAPVQVHALPETLAALHRHVFNNQIWPDFSALPRGRPYMNLVPLKTGEVLDIGNKRVEALPARHSVPAVGYAVSRSMPAQPAPCWVFSGDTGPNRAFWERVNALDVGMLVIETAFSDDEAELAAASGHMSPAVLAESLTHIAADKTFPIYISHTKPAEVSKIMGQLKAANRNLSRPLDVRWLATGQLLHL